MALILLNYLWKVIKDLFWNTDEDKRSGDEIPRSETENPSGRFSREPGDSTGRRSDYRIFDRQYETYDLFVRTWDVDWNVDYNNSRYFETSDEDTYRFKNYGVLDDKHSHFYGDAKHFEDRCLRKDYRYFNKSFSYAGKKDNFNDENVRYSYDVYRNYGEHCKNDRFYQWSVSSDSSDDSYSSDEYWRHREKSFQQGGHFKETARKRVFRNDKNLKERVEICKIPQKIKDNGISHKPLNHSSSLLKEHEFMENFLFNFYKLLQDYLSQKLSLSDHDIKRAMKKLIFNYKNLNRCKTPETLDFNDFATCVGYLHRYAICHAVMVYHAIIKIILDSPLFFSVFSRQKLSMMCLGSGPGNDFIGFALALMNFRIKISNIDVTVVDMFYSWFTIFSETIDMFNSLTKNAYEKPSKTFIQADLSKFSSWDSYMKKSLNGADIVTLVKVLSNISEDNHLHILKNIVRLMKDDAFLIIIDCPLPSVELSTLKHFLYPVYSSSKEKFNFKEKRFGYPNISRQCTAYIMVYKKRNSSQLRFYR